MLPDYDDIREAVGRDRPPLWFDGGGVPRYAPFTTQMLGVYDDFALLVRIECQSCQQRFLVGTGWTRFSLRRDPVEEWTLEALAERYHYGDPPIHGCVGDTMNCVDLEIMEAWEKVGETEERESPTGSKYNVYTVLPEWTRRPDLEKHIEDG